MRACACCGGTEHSGARLPRPKPQRSPLLCDECVSLPAAVRAQRIAAHLAGDRRAFPQWARGGWRADLRRRGAAQPGPPDAAGTASTRPVVRAEQSRLRGMPAATS
jgi:hypothetical protein